LSLVEPREKLFRNVALVRMVASPWTAALEWIEARASTLVWLEKSNTVNS
jgi:hypothetical protein